MALPAGLSEGMTWQMHSPESWELNGACSTVHTTSLLYHVEDNISPNELLLAVVQAMHTSSITHEQA